MSVVKDWSVQEVAKWLQTTVKLPEDKINNFKKHDVNGMVLTGLSKEDMMGQELRLSSFEAQKVLTMLYYEEIPGISQSEACQAASEGHSLMSIISCIQATGSVLSIGRAVFRTFGGGNETPSVDSPPSIAEVGTFTFDSSATVDSSATYPDFASAAYADFESAAYADFESAAYADFESATYPDFASAPYADFESAAYADFQSAAYADFESAAAAASFSGAYDAGASAADAAGAADAACASAADAAYEGATEGATEGLTSSLLDAFASLFGQTSIWLSLMVSD